MKTYLKTMNDSYYALLLCILREDCGVDKAISIIFNDKYQSNRDWTVTKDDVADMVALHASGLSYKEIGAIYNLSRQATMKRIQRYRDKEGNNYDENNKC